MAPADHRLFIIPRRPSQVKLAQIAEEAGYSHALTQIRFMGGYGAEYQHESVTFSQHLLAHTKKLKVRIRSKFESSVKGLIAESCLLTSVWRLISKRSLQPSFLDPGEL